MSSLFGLRQLSPKSFSKLQKEQHKQGVEFAPRRATRSSTSSSTTTTTTSNNRQSDASTRVVASPTDQETNPRRHPLVSLSSTAFASRQKNSLVTIRGKFGERGGNGIPSSFQNNNDEDLVKPLPSVKQSRAVNSRSSVVSVVTTADENQRPTDFLLNQQILQLQQACEEMSKSSSSNLPAEWFRHLHDGLVSIQDDMKAVETERSYLTKESQELHRQRQDLKHQLESREKELQLLSKRCAQQSDKLKAVHRLQASHNSLSTQANELKAVHDEQLKTVQNMESQLTTVSAQNQSLQGRLDQVQKDYSAVSERLDSTLRQLQRLTEEKQEWQTERGRLEQQMAWQQQQQQVSWTEEKGNLQEQISSKDELIRILREEVAKLQKTEKEFEGEMYQMTLRHEEELALRKKKEDQRIQELNKQHALETKAQIEDSLRAHLEEARVKYEKEMVKLRDEHSVALQMEREQRQVAEAELLKERQAGQELLRVQAEKHEQDEQALVTEFEKLLAHEVETVQNEHDSKVQELQNFLTEHKETIRHLNEQIELLRKSNREDFSTLQQTRDESEKRLQDEHDALVSGLRATIKNHRTQIDALLATRHENLQLIEDLTSESERRIVELQALHQAALNRLQTNALEAIQRLQKSLQEQHERVTELQCNLEDWKRRHKGQSDVHSRSVSQANAQIESLHEQIQQLASKNEILVDANEKLQQDKDTLSHNTVKIQSTLNAAVAKQHADLKSQVSTLETAVEDLNAKVKERTLTIEKLESELEHTMEELMVVSSELESAREDSKLIDSLTADLEALQLEKTATEEALHDKDLQIAELEAEILKLEMENEMERQQCAKAESVNANRKATHTREVQSLRNYISELRRDLDQVSRQLVDYRRLHAKSQSIVDRLEEEVRLTNEAAVRDSTCSSEVTSQQRREIQRLLEHHDAERQILQDKVSSLEHDLSRVTKTHNAQLKGKENTISNLTIELHNTRTELQKMSSDGSAEYSTIREQLHHCRLEMSRRDDELNALKCDTIVNLRCEIQELNNRIVVFEQTIVSLENEKRILLKERDDLAAEISEKSSKNQIIVEQLNKSIESQKEKLTENTRNSIQQQKELESLRNESKRALDRYEEAQAIIAQNDHLNKLVDEMERDARLKFIELQEEKARTNELESTLRQTQLDLEAQEKRAESLRAARDTTRHELTKLGDDFAAKTRQCADVMSKLTIANTELESCKQRLREAQLDTECFELRLGESNAECARMAVALDEKDAACMASLEHERALRELASEELHDLKARFETMQNEKQANADLLKEVNELKNKIRRQEAYLQRRLNKERIARQRSGIQKQENSRGDRGPPRRINISESFSSHTSGPKPIVPDVSLIDWDSSSVELDSLLAD